MESESIAAAHERMAEQLQSDEHILGALPDDASSMLLHWALARLDAAAVGAVDLAALEAAFEQIRADARAVAEEAATRDEDAGALAARLGMGEAAVAPPPTLGPVQDEQPPLRPPEASELQAAESEPPAPVAEPPPVEAHLSEPPAIPWAAEPNREEAVDTELAEPPEAEAVVADRGLGGFWRRLRGLFGGGGGR